MDSNRAFSKILQLGAFLLAGVGLQNAAAQPYFTTSGTTWITSNTTISNTDWALAGPQGDPPRVNLGNGATLTINDPVDGAYLVVGLGGGVGGGPGGSFGLASGATINVVGTAAFPGSGIAVGYMGGIGSFDMAGGTIDLSSTATPATATNLAIGTAGGNGTFTQTGGTVSLGNNFAVGSGAGSVGFYSITGGTLQNTTSGVSGIHYVGDDGGTGTLEIGGTATVNFAGTSGLWIGGDGVGGSGPSSGLVEQDGGTVTFTGNGIYLAGQVGDTGTYELNDGTLEIGGGKLMKGAGDALFQMNGGTLRVIESGLVTAVDTMLVTNSVSTIDTNGLSARFQGEFSGGGDLDKTGDGQLLVSGSATVGALQIAEGSARIDGDLVAESVRVGDETDATELELRSANNHVTGDVTLEVGAALIGAISAEGTMTVEMGALQDLKKLSQATETGSYILDGELTVDLSGVDFNLARLTAELILIGDDATISFYASGTRPAIGTNFAFFSDMGTVSGFENIEFIGLGSLGGWVFTLDDETGVINAVPEPSTYALIALGAALVWMMRRRRSAGVIPGR